MDQAKQVTGGFGRIAGSSLGKGVRDGVWTAIDAFHGEILCHDFGAGTCAVSAGGTAGSLLLVAVRIPTRRVLWHPRHDSAGPCAAGIAFHTGAPGCWKRRVPAGLHWKWWGQSMPYAGGYR